MKNFATRTDGSVWTPISDPPANGERVIVTHADDDAKRESRGRRHRPEHAVTNLTQRNLSMTNRGTAFLLKVGDGTSTPSYSTVAGLKTESLAINGEPVPLIKQTGWRVLLSGAGVRSVTISASGIFTGSAAEAEVKQNALAGSVEPYEMSFESGERMRGQFLVTRLEYAGDFNGERNYRIALESSGEVTAL